MLIAAWGGNQFTPLLLVYREHAGFSQVDVDVLLAAYVFGLIPGLLVAGALSEVVGRRLVMRAGLTFSILGSLVLAVGDQLGFTVLLVGRALSGVAVGAAMAVGSTWVAELSDPDCRPGVGARRAAVALSLGFGLGPAAAGLIAEVLSRPLVLPYVAHALLGSLVLLVVLLRGPEETRLNPAAPRSLNRLLVPSAVHPRFLRVVLPMAPWIFGSAGIAYAIVPMVVEGAVGRWALLFTSGLTVLTLGSGVVVQPVARRLDDASTARAVVVSMVLMTSGVLLAALTALTRSAPLAVLVSVVLGSAYGIAIVSGLLEVQRIAGEGEVAGLTGVYYSLAYAGFLLPAVLAALHSWFGYPGMLVTVAGLCAACTAVCATGWARHIPTDRT